MKPLHLAEGHVADLDTLIDTRLLVQANSGGGKSWCIRRLLEQTHGQVQHLVIDPEGEFATLRERFDYVLAARHGGDTAADPRTAKLLAERLLELGVSAVLDIYELKAHERVRFVRQFLEALVDAPKKLWHRALVVVDEAHVYCPEKGQAESGGAVIDLATRGRKRGFCAVLATQRLSKLHKDAAAECNNKLIGRTGLDIDVKRAADELGFPKDRWRELRELDPGQFFAFGPALSREVVALKVGPVNTTHPKAGARLAAPPPPPREKVKALLPKLADLPAEVEERQKTVEDLQRENVQLRRELRQQVPNAGNKITAPPTVQRVEVPVLKDTQAARLEKAAERFGKAGEAVAQVSRELLEVLRKLGNGHRPTSLTTTRTPSLGHANSGSLAGVRPPRKTPAASEPTAGLSASQQRILDSLAWLEMVGIPRANKTQVALLADQSPTSGGYFNNLGRLRSLGLVDYPRPGRVVAQPVLFLEA